MKKIINKKLYNTETATALGSYQYSNEMDFNYMFEELYRKKNRRILPVRRRWCKF